MAIRGPRPMPTALKILAGGKGRNPTNHDEPVIEGAVNKPRHLKDRAAEIWDQFAVPLVTAGVLKSVDIYLMAVWCELAAHMEEVGAPSMNARMLGQFRQISGELGLTPSARTRLHVPRPPTQQENRFFRKEV